MRLGLYVPLDELAGELRDPDAAADFLELAAFFAEDGFVRTSDVANEASIGADEEPTDLDDKVDVFAARPHPDRQPGFLFAVAQVATGKDWKEKSLLGHLNAFKRRWFADAPVTRFIPYMIVPFAVADLKLRDHVSFLGNMLHRLRVPARVAEARSLVDAGIKIEAYDRLQEVVDWVASYRDRAREAA